MPHRCQAGQSRKRVRSLPRRALIRHVVAGTLAGGFRSSTSEAMLGILREISTDYLAKHQPPWPWRPERWRKLAMGPGPVPGAPPPRAGATTPAGEEAQDPSVCGKALRTLGALLPELAATRRRVRAPGVAGAHRSP